jgi:hypothetical protein
MPMASVILRPGVNTQYTEALNEAGVSQSQLIRYQQGLTQKYGGWDALFGSAIGSTVRDLHPWGGLTAGHYHLGIGTTQSLTIYHSDNGTVEAVTPQTETRNFTPSFSVSSGSNIVTIVDGGSSTSTYQNVFFNTQVAIGTLLLEGAYQINTVGGSSIYTILATANSCTTVASSGILPVFTTGANSAVVTVVLPNHGYTATPGLFRQFIAPTTVGGQTIQGPYEISTVIDTTSFTIALTALASAAGTATMNASQAQLVYYRTQGPLPAGSGFGSGGFGSGGFGSGATPSAGTGTPITAADWTMDNWGEVLLACPKDGPIYTWAPNAAFTTADVITEAPFFNGGIFISMPQQILVAWRSCQSTGVQDPLRVRWCDAGDFTNWTVSNQTTAGSFHVPTGSRIVGGMQGPTQGIISTDIDVWLMQYVGGTVIFNFSRVGSGCGWIGPHAAGILGGNLFWCGGNNFFMLSGRGVQDIPCPVWDFFFQNLNIANQEKVQCATNSLFSEVTWFFPSANATECDSYVKLNTADGAWDYGSLSRTAWTDVSILGNPIGADSSGFIWEHEITNDAGGGAMSTFFQSGYWRIQEGNELAFVDFIIPDMKFGTYSGGETATVQITFYAVDYLGDTPRAYGPYVFTSTTQYINVRIRGRYLAVRIASDDSGSFWRLGRINYRWAVSGRR